MLIANFLSHCSSGNDSIHVAYDKFARNFPLRRRSAPLRQQLSSGTDRPTAK